MAASKKLLLITILGVILAGGFTIFSNPLADPDMVQYDRLGYNLAEGAGFSLDVRAPYLPTMFREPGYPVFIAALYVIFGHSPKVVIFAQIVLHVLTALIIYGMSREIFSEKIAFLSGILAAVFPTLANMPSYLMSETFFTFLLCLGTYLFLKALKVRNMIYFLVSGVVFGILILTKTASLFLPFGIAFAALIINAKKKLNLKQLSVFLIIFLVPCFFMVSAWSIRNKKVFDTFTLTLRGGDVMWSRAEKIDDSGGEILATACSSFSEYLGRKLFPGMIAKKESYLYKDLHKVNEIKTEYAKNGMEPDKIDAILKKEAFNKIAKHPFKYLFYTPVEAIKMTAFSYLPFLNEDKVCDYFTGITGGGAMLSILKGIFRLIAYPLLLLSFIGGIKNLKIWDRWLALFTIILYFNTVYSLMDAIGRYAIVLIPFYCIFASAAFFKPDNL